MFNSIYFKELSVEIYVLINIILSNLLGIGDWGLGIGDWGLGVGSPIPNPQSFSEYNTDLL